MQFVSIDVMFHEKQRTIKFFRYIFSKWFRSNTEQFLLHRRIEVSSVCYTEPTDNLLWIPFNKKYGQWSPFRHNIQLFRQRLSHKSVKAYATMLIGIMGRKSLALIDWGSWFLPTRKEKTYIDLFVMIPSMSLKHLKPQSNTINPHYP